VSTKPRASLAACVFIAAVGSAYTAAAATVLDFETTPVPGGPSFHEQGVTITRNGGFDIALDHFAPTDSRTLLGTNGLAASSWTAVFDQLATSVSIDLGDVGSDEDHIFLSAFNQADELVGKDTLFLSNLANTMFTLHVAGAGIKSIAFGTEAPGIGGIYADNLTYAPVPVPAALPMILSALAGLSWLGWRSRRPH
jgi:hypothetical protein